MCAESSAASLKREKKRIGIEKNSNQREFSPIKYNREQWRESEMQGRLILERDEMAIDGAE